MMEIKTETNSAQNNEKPFYCDFCDVRFASQRNRIRHIKEKHTRHKFPCTKCQRPFNRVSYMKIHAAKCSGPKITCDICKKQFGTLERHSKHMMSQHVEKVHRKRGRRPKYPLTPEDIVDGLVDNASEKNKPVTIMVESTDELPSVEEMGSPTRLPTHMDDFIQFLASNRDDAESFAMSLIPTFRRLSQRKLQQAKIQISQLLFALEYGDQDDVDDEQARVEVVVQDKHDMDGSMEHSEHENIEDMSNI